MSGLDEILRLPPAERSHSGWPWTLDSAVHGQVPASELDWPKISVITPSFNQAEFLEATIRSVLLQGYPNLEYVVLDGGSSDGSVDIIKKYSPWLSHWESRPDHGQSDAINRGLRATTGEIQCWLNSDDYFAPGTLAHVARCFCDAPETLWLIGSATLLDHQGAQTIRPARVLTESELVRWTRSNWFCQQATFWRKSFIERTGFLDESLHYVMDWELWLRFYAIAPPQIIDQSLAFYRFHENAKCVDKLDSYYVEETRLLLSIVESSDVGLLAKYRDDARNRLAELLANAYHVEGNQRATLESYGSFELMREVAKRALGIVVPNRSTTGKP